MSASEGVHGKADVVREVARILPYESVPNEDEGGGVKISKNFADIISGSSLESNCHCTPSHSLHAMSVGLVLSGCGPLRLNFTFRRRAALLLSVSVVGRAGSGAVEFLQSM